MSKLATMSDEDMVTQQRAAMTNPNAPAASIDHHAILPFRFVDHSHANAISALTCAADGEARVQELYGQACHHRALRHAGLHPGKTIAELIAGRDLRMEGIQGMVLLKHGLFTFDDDARKSYELHIEMVTMAEDYLAKKGPTVVKADASEDLMALAKLRHAVSKVRGVAQIARLNASPEAVGYASIPNVATFGTRGPLTPDHSIRTKRAPAFISEDIDASVQKFADDYAAYFQRHANGQTMLDAAPRFAIWPGKGIVSFGDTLKDAKIVFDIAESTAATVQLGEAVGGWSRCRRRTSLTSSIGILNRPSCARAPPARCIRARWRSSRVVRRASASPLQRVLRSKVRKSSASTSTRTSRPSWRRSAASASL